MAAFEITPDAEAVLRHAVATARGAEPCGYLLGRANRVERVVHGHNAHPRPATAFRLAPEEQLGVRRDARRAGLELLGIWHGHLAGPARASRADRRGHGPLAPPWMVVAGRAPGGGAEIRAYRSFST